MQFSNTTPKTIKSLDIEIDSVNDNLLLFNHKGLPYFIRLELPQVLDKCLIELVKEQVGNWILDTTKIEVDYSKKSFSLYSFIHAGCFSTSLIEPKEKQYQKILIEFKHVDLLVKELKNICIDIEFDGIDVVLAQVFKIRSPLLAHNKVDIKNFITITVMNNAKTPVTCYFNLVVKNQLVEFSPFESSFNVIFEF